MKFPGYVAQILTRLTKQGYEAYAVGGCVRDSLLGRQAEDWDITTNAKPAQVMALFEKCVPTGLRHGTVTVVLEGGRYEVTTFRRDGAYLDGRHPQNVTFASSLREDLSRRDFTVNAMAMDLQGRLYDFFEGREDLQAGLLRCVGDPMQRFSEDALRMLRAVRFSAQLDFSVDPAAVKAMKRCAPLCGSLSCERIREEIRKTLLSSQPEKIGAMISLGLLQKLGLSGSWDLSFLSGLPRQETVRWAGLKRCLPALDLHLLRLDRHTEMLAGRAAALYTSDCDRQTLKALIGTQGEELARCVAEMNGSQAIFEEIMASGECVSLGMLAVNGSDFTALSGKEVGQMLRFLLAHVLEHPADNRRELLLALAKQKESRLPGE